MKKELPEMEIELIDPNNVPNEVKRAFELRDLERKKERLLLEEKLDLELERLKIKYLDKEKSLWGDDFQKFEDLQRSIYEESLKIREQINDKHKRRKIIEFQVKSRKKLQKLMEQVGLDQEKYQEIQYEHMSDTQSLFDKLRGSQDISGFSSNKSTMLKYIESSIPWRNITSPYNIFSFFLSENFGLPEYPTVRYDCFADPSTGDMLCNSYMFLMGGLEYQDPSTGKIKRDILAMFSNTSILGTYFQMPKKGKLEVTFYLENKNSGPTQCDLELSPNGISTTPHAIVRSDMKISISHYKHPNETNEFVMVDKQFNNNSPTYSYSEPFDVNKPVWPLRFTSNNIYDVGEWLMITLSINDYFYTYDIVGSFELNNEWRLMSIELRPI